MDRHQFETVKKKPALIISELFSSIQGESSYAGRPCFFIRLAGCNLNCSYCDTGYARTMDGREYSVEELVRKAGEAGIDLVEITGGEPLLQDNVSLLCEQLLVSGFEVLVETNGSVSIASLPDAVIKIMDCKSPSSGESGKMDFNNFTLLSPHDEVKFVISDKADYEYAKNIMAEFSLDKSVGNILLSPDSSINGLPAELAEWMLNDKIHARIQLQLHKILWHPDARGR